MTNARQIKHYRAWQESHTVQTQKAVMSNNSKAPESRALNDSEGGVSSPHTSLAIHVSLYSRRAATDQKKN